MAKKPKAKGPKEKCKEAGCRRVAGADGRCGKCREADGNVTSDVVQKDAPTDPSDACKRLTRMELLQLGKLSAEIEKALMQLRLFQYDVRDLQASAEEQLRQALQAKEVERKDHAEYLRRIRSEYAALTLELSKRHGIDDPKCMVVDPDTGVIHDSRTL